MTQLLAVMTAVGAPSIGLAIAAETLVEGEDVTKAVVWFAVARLRRQPRLRVAGPTPATPATQRTRARPRITTMATLVLTVIGDDRAGLVSALADIVSSHGGNWSRSQLAELSGKFAGIVEVEVDDARSSELTNALAPLAGLLDVTVHAGAAGEPVAGEAIGFELVGNDRPGIVLEVTSVLHDHRVSIDRFESEIVEAPMAGGCLFRATVAAHVVDASDARAAVESLQQLAGELMVDLELH